MMTISLMDLREQYAVLRPDLDAALARVLDSGRFIGGPEVDAFNAEFAAYHGLPYALGCANGTDALELALDALGVGRGDEVIVPASSWISTSEVVATRGATPVFVDVDDYHCLDPTGTAAALTDRTRAVIVVHLYGHPADLTALTALCERHDLPLIEDCAQSHGARWRGQRTGTFGRAGTFSFFPSKSLGAFGDAGAVVTDDTDLHERMRALANHGMFGRRHVHQVHGRNSRLDALQAAVLRAKLPHLDDWIAAKNRAAAGYRERLSALDLAANDLEAPPVHADAYHGYHLFVVQSDRRDALGEFLGRQGIATSVHYPTPLPMHECYAAAGHRPEAFPRAVRLSERALSLPMFAELTEAQLDYVTDRIGAFFKSSATATP